MEILWLTENYLPNRGGMAQSCDRIVRSLRAKGIKIHLVHFTNRAKAFHTEEKLGGTYTAIPVFPDIAHTLNRGLNFLTNPELTAETVIIRGFGSLAILMLHIILVIGPLTRLHSNFLPLLYNRRHLGVSMFLAALVHGVFSIIQFHTLGNKNPIYSIFTENMEKNGRAGLDGALPSVRIRRYGRRYAGNGPSH